MASLTLELNEKLTEKQAKHVSKKIIELLGGLYKIYPTKGFEKSSVINAYLKK